jgi:hypothetical protein
MENFYSYNKAKYGENFASYPFTLKLMGNDNKWD